MKKITIFLILSSLISCIDVHTVAICNDSNAVDLKITDGIYEGSMFEEDSDFSDITDYKLVNKGKGKINLTEVDSGEEANQIQTCNVQGKIYAEFYDEIQNTYMITEVSQSLQKTIFSFKSFDREFLNTKGFFYQSVIGDGMSTLNIASVEPILLYNEQIPTADFMKALVDAPFKMSLRKK